MLNTHFRDEQMEARFGIITRKVGFHGCFNMKHIISKELKKAAS